MTRKEVRVDPWDLLSPTRNKAPGRVTESQGWKAPQRPSPTFVTPASANTMSPLEPSASPRWAIPPRRVSSPPPELNPPTLGHLWMLKNSSSYWAELCHSMSSTDCPGAEENKSTLTSLDLPSKIWRRQVFHSQLTQFFRSVLVGRSLKPCHNPSHWPCTNLPRQEGRPLAYLLQNWTLLTHPCSSLFP